MKAIYNAVFVDKEFIPQCKFPSDNIQETIQEIADLKSKLFRAAILGNLEKLKCKIYFMDESEVRVVETTIWAACEKNILLKSGIYIPIRRIIDIVI